jgi:N-acetylglucosaminyl-diphospho-decaprenol L-rhamnosyltransferase
MPAEITVVVGNYEGEGLLGDILGSLDGQTRPAAASIVVDAMSSDRSAALAKELGAHVLIRENRGLGYLYNEGAKAASTPYVFLVNNDVALDSRCLELLGAELDRDERRFAADPRQMSWSGEELVHARAMLTRGPMLRQPLPGFRLDLTVPADEVVPTVSANGGAMLVRRERLLDLGGFDETMFMDFEDIDLCWRAWLQGWESVYVPDAYVRHRVGAVTTPGAVQKRRLVSSHHNLMRFALKCFPARDAAIVLGGELLRLPRHPRLIAPAMARIGRELREIAGARRKAQPTTSHMRWCLEGMR